MYHYPYRVVPVCLQFSYSDLAEATENFSRKNLVGQGGNGSVFRGILRNGSEIAVKLMSRDANNGFLEEVQVLSMLRHKNLVTLMGCCEEPKKLLVYELMDGGDFATSIKYNQIDFNQRISCLEQAACGLAYMHGCPQRVFHRDIKTANLLLDKSRRVCKVADFGLACSSNTARLHCASAAGTPGYADPDYIQTRDVTERSEVYSFGIVLLETLTSLPPLRVEGGKPDFLVNRLLKGNAREEVLKLVDGRVKFPLASAKELISLSLACLSPKRPSFEQILRVLRRMVKLKDHQIVEIKEIKKINEVEEKIEEIENKIAKNKIAKNKIAKNKISQEERSSLLVAKIRVSAEMPEIRIDSTMRRSGPLQNFQDFLAS